MYFLRLPQNRNSNFIIYVIYFVNVLGMSMGLFCLRKTYYTNLESIFISWQVFGFEHVSTDESNNIQVLGPSMWRVNWTVEGKKCPTSRTKVVTMTVQTLPSMLTLCHLTCSSNCFMQSAGVITSPSGESQNLKELSTSCNQ